MSSTPFDTLPFVLDTRHVRLAAQPADATAALDRLLLDAVGPAGFLEVPDDRTTLDTTLSLARAIPERFRRVLVLGIGGSALGTSAALAALAPVRRPGREVRVLANLDPVSLADALAWFDPQDTLLNVVTKSGGTVETLTQFCCFADRIRTSRGPEGLQDGIVCTTDPANGTLRKITDRIGCATLPVPPRVGGRFSVLTPVGLFPLALAGCDVSAMLEGARQVFALLRGPDRLAHPSVRSASAQVALMSSGATVRVWWAYCDRLATLGDWFCQLWAESLGKPGHLAPVGQTPVRAIGSTDQHSLLQLFMEGPLDKAYTMLTVGAPMPAITVPDFTNLDPALGEFAGKPVFDVFDALRSGTMAALIQAGRPVAHLHIPKLDDAAVGAMFAHFELETALSGYLMGIDPFDQPGVEAGKRFAHGVLGRLDMAAYRDEAARLLSGEVNR